MRIMKAIYFSHDTNSFYDPKIRILIGKYGVWSYAVFWIILEMLATQKDYHIQIDGFAEGLYPILQSKKINYKAEDGIGFFEDDEGNPIDSEHIGRFSICLAEIKALLASMFKVGLFKLNNNNFFYSESLLERMSYRDKISSKRKEIGRLGGLSKGKQMLSKQNSKCLAVKESKVKESKVNNKDICSSFEDIWLKYPKRIGKKAAERHFEASVKTTQDWQDINKALENYLKSDTVAKKYIQNGSTWFNNWKDWVDLPQESVYSPNQLKRPL